MFWLGKSVDHVATFENPPSLTEASSSEGNPIEPEAAVQNREIIRRSQKLSRESDATLDSRLELTIHYMKATNARQAQAVIDDIRASGDSVLAKDLEFEIRGRCGFLDGFEPPFERTRWAFELIQDYCTNYLPRIDESGEIPIGAGTKNLAYTRLRTKLSELEATDFDSYFMDFIANVNSMQELKAAESLAKDLQRSGTPLSFGMVNDRLVTPSESKLVLETAFELYGCVRFSGCEQHDMRVLEYCVLTGNCERGWNMFDIYSYTLAPYVYEQVTNVLTNMINAGKSEN